MTLDRTHLMAGFGRAAAEYDARAVFQREQVARLFALAQSQLRARSRVLDLGCGTGYYAQLSERSENKIIGLDLAFPMARIAAKRCVAVQGDARALPFASGSMDAVVSSLCLQWVEDLPALCAELARVLVPGGRAVLLTLGPQTLHELRNHAARAALPLGLLAMRSAEIYCQALRESGLTILSCESRLERRYYPSVRALLDSMRAIGAGNHAPRENRKVAGRARWQAMLAAYEAQRGEQGIPACWEVIELVVENTR